MGKTEEKDDANSLEIENESLEADADLPNEKNTKSESNQDEDGNASQHEKGNIGNTDNSRKKDKEKKRKKESTDCDPESRNEKKKKLKSKKVTFSSEVEVFPNANTDNKNPDPKKDNLLRGKRFTREEDKIVKEAVLDYIKTHDLGEKGLEMILNCGSHPGLKKHCWKEIGARIPYRPHTAVYYRAHVLFEQAEKREWTKEETEILRESYKKHGSNWKLVAEELGKHRFHVKDKWRRIKLENLKGGRWSQDEYKGLYDLVNLNLQTKVASEEKKSKYGMLRDNIPWTAISEKLTTRNDSTCCKKWYEQLTSSLVDEGKWSNADDYRLIRALYELDAACVEDVEWDGVLEHRSGDVCRKRWGQMVLHIGQHGSKPFSEQVEILSQRYCPDLAEVREDWDSRPSVD